MQQSIESKENARIKEIIKLSLSASARREAGLFVAETPKLVLDLAAFGAEVKEVYYTQRALKNTPQLEGLPGAHFFIRESVAEKISGQKSASGVYMLAKLPVSDPLYSGRRYVALEHVQDPANVGAVLRAAAAFGIDGVVLTRDSADPFSPKALRASMGAAVKLPVFWADDIAATARAFAGQGFAVAAAMLEGAVDIDKYAAPEKLLILIGSEGQGLSQQAQQAAAVRLKIPMSGNTESLNAAVAAAIFIWQFRGEANHA